MPTYVYKILKTGKTFEVEQRMTEAAWTKHPQTGAAVERVIQAAGIVFKGGGFYKTDSRPSEKSGGKTDKKTDAVSGTAADANSSTTSSSEASTTGSSDSSKKAATTDSSSAKSSGSGSSGSDSSGSSQPAKASKKD